LATLRSLASARHLLFASLIYLPVLLVILAFDKVTFSHSDPGHLSAHTGAIHDHHAGHHPGHPMPVK